MTDDFIKAAELHLRVSDPVLGELIRSQVLVPRGRQTDYFSSLCSSIIGQQVSVAAAKAIFIRLKEVTDLQPLRVLNISEEEVRFVGLSKQKVAYLKDLSRHFVDDPTVYNHLEQRTDEQVITELTAVKGIGVWTAQMFMMFTLSRPDVFAPDDAGLQRAMSKLYKWETLPSRQDLERTASAWAPYRTIASFHLWQSLNNTPA